ncbi:type VI secretion protein IcmF/TssM N-terminal domain-containing protein [Massilia sp. Se16.2.3]|uniref:type VI secretion protein IcmF/TssM N-terminal domain-containing protein n=1 Tax=Massilia sp. Se16.2.3 TaxID=2709303 RepID=UPI0022772D53|nr:type VI secretion protein IcmF/TssM N-terminal domain-containing protein [Massilia sp. Se16.2.3]
MPWRREVGEEAVATVVARLRRLAGALAARRDPGEHGAPIFLMPERIAAGLAQLPAALHAAMRPNAVLTPFSLRGIYLSGRALPAAPRATVAADPFAPPPAPGAPAAPLFCRDLFATRIFGEFGLAQPVARRVAADRRARRVVLAASAFVAAVWLVALVPTWFSLDRQLQSMRTPLLGMHNAILDAGRDVRIDERATIELLSDIDRVPDWDTRRAALPLSWFACCGGLEPEVQGAFRSYYEKVLFDSLDEAPDERAARLTADAPAPAAASALFASPERMAEFVAMREFVAATLEFEYQHARFETLAGVRGGTGRTPPPCSPTCSA